MPISTGPSSQSPNLPPSSSPPPNVEKLPEKYKGQENVLKVLKNFQTETTTNLAKHEFKGNLGTLETSMIRDFTNGNWIENEMDFNALKRNISDLNKEISKTQHTEEELNIVNQEMRLMSQSLVKLAETKALSPQQNERLMTLAATISKVQKKITTCLNTKSSTTTTQSASPSTTVQKNPIPSVSPSTTPKPSPARPPATNLAEVVRNKIEKAIEAAYSNPEFEESLGKWHGAGSNDNVRLHGYHPNSAMEPVDIPGLTEEDYSDMDLREMTKNVREAQFLISKGFRQLKTPIPPDISNLLRDIDEDLDLLKAQDDIRKKLAGIIETAYSKKGFEQALGKWWGAKSGDNIKLQGRDLSLVRKMLFGEQLGLAQLNFLTKGPSEIEKIVNDAEDLIAKGFENMGKAVDSGVLSQFTDLKKDIKELKVKRASPRALPKGTQTTPKTPANLEPVDLNKAVGEVLKGAIDAAYRDPDFKGSIGRWMGGFSSENAQLGKIGKANYSKLELNDVVQNFETAKKILNNGFKQLNKNVPEETLRALKQVEKEVKLLKDKEQIRVGLERVIESAYADKGFQKSLGQWLGSFSDDNVKLHGYHLTILKKLGIKSLSMRGLADQDFLTMPPAEVIRVAEEAEFLIEQGFRQMGQDRVPSSITNNLRQIKENARALIPDL